WRRGPRSRRARTDEVDVAALGAYLASEIFHGGLNAAASMRDVERGERHLDRAEHAEHHRCVDVAHVSDPEGSALEIADPPAEDDAALLATVVAERARLAAWEKHRGHRVRALLGTKYVECEHAALRPSAHGVTRRLGEQRVATDRGVEAFFEKHVERLAQAEEQVLRRRAPVPLVVRFAAAERPVPVARSEISVLVRGVRAVVGRDERETGRRHQPLL